MTDEELLQLLGEERHGHEAEVAQGPSEQADLWGRVPMGDVTRSAGRTQPKRAGRLDGVLGRMAAEQLRPVLQRFAPGSRAARKDEMIAEVRSVLDSPARLDVVVERLEPLERAMLEELARRGGTTDGWELVTFAVLHGYGPPAGLTGGSAYGRALARSPAAAYLTRLIIDGALLPTSTEASWFQYGRGGSAIDLITADERLLARVSSRPTTTPLRLVLDEVGAVDLDDRHPAAVVLEVLEVLQLVAGEGGVHVTRSDTVAKPFLARLRRRRPLRAERHEALLRTLMSLGVVRRPDSPSRGVVWPVDVESVRSYRRLPLFMLYAAIVDATCYVGDPDIDRAWNWGSMDGPHDPQPFWRAMVDALAALPEQPAAVGPTAKAIWDRVLEPVFGSAMLPWSVRFGEEGWPTTIQDVLVGPFRSIGLLATGETNGPDGKPVRVLALATGARWYALARALLEGRQLPDSVADSVRDIMADAGAAAAADTKAAGPRGRPADAVDTTGKEPSLLVQPNFEVLAYLDRLDSSALAALDCASVQRIDAHTATFLLERTSLEHALELGATIDGVLAQLSAHAPGVPGNVAATLRDWAARRERLRVQLGVNVLEYASAAERDTALAALAGARAVGERFALLTEGASTPKASAQYDYREPPARTLVFAGDGRVSAKGKLDLAVRAALRRVARPRSGGTYELDVDKIRGGALTPAVRAVLDARSTKGFPPQLDALVRIWSGSTPRPAVAAASLFRHPDAAALARLPQVAPLLDVQLSPSTFVVKAGKEAALRKQLLAHGLEVGTEVGSTRAVLAAEGEGALLSGLSTRKKRELIEAAIDAGHTVELSYVEERERWDRYGSVRRSRGKARRELVKPEAVSYRGSLPYLVATTLKRGTERFIRIGYIDALAVRAEEAGV